MAAALCGSEDMMMKTVKFVYWKEDGVWMEMLTVCRRYGNMVR